MKTGRQSQTLNGLEEGGAVEVLQVVNAPESIATESNLEGQANPMLSTKSSPSGWKTVFGPTRSDVIAWWAKSCAVFDPNLAELPRTDRLHSRGRNLRRPQRRPTRVESLRGMRYSKWLATAVDKAGQIKIPYGR